MGYSVSEMTVNIRHAAVTAAARWLIDQRPHLRYEHNRVVISEFEEMFSCKALYDADRCITAVVFKSEQDGIMFLLRWG